MEVNAIRNREGHVVGWLCAAFLGSRGAGGAAVLEEGPRGRVQELMQQEPG